MHVFANYRKIQHKKVCEVQAEKLSSDIWAWRKYGQKPIKGSPYPRSVFKNVILFLVHKIFNKFKEK